MLYFSKIQDDSYRIIAPISCIMASFHKLNQTDIVGCVLSLLVTILSIRSAPCGSILHSNSYYTVVAGILVSSATSCKTIHGVKSVRN